MPCHDQKIGVWCEITATQIAEQIFENPSKSVQYVSDILWSFFRALWKRTILYFMHDSATAHTASYPIYVLN